MLDLILRNKEWLFSGIGVVVIGLVARFILSRVRANRQEPLPEFENTRRSASPGLWLPFSSRHTPTAFELRPISFMIDLAQTLPYIEIRYYAVNYLTRELHLREVTISTFNLSSTPMLERIPLAQECMLEPESTTMVIFRRALTDSEARVFRQEPPPYYPRSTPFSPLPPS